MFFQRYLEQGFREKTVIFSFLVVLQTNSGVYGFTGLCKTVKKDGQKRLEFKNLIKTVKIETTLTPL